MKMPKQNKRWHLPAIQVMWSKGTQVHNFSCPLSSGNLNVFNVFPQNRGQVWWPLCVRFIVSWPVRKTGQSGFRSQVEMKVNCSSFKAATIGRPLSPCCYCVPKLCLIRNQFSWPCLPQQCIHHWTSSKWTSFLLSGKVSLSLILQPSHQSFEQSPGRLTSLSMWIKWTQAKQLKCKTRWIYSFLH